MSGGRTSPALQGVQGPLDLGLERMHRIDDLAPMHWINIAIGCGDRADCFQYGIGAENIGDAFLRQPLPDDPLGAVTGSAQSDELVGNPLDHPFRRPHAIILRAVLG